MPDPHIFDVDPEKEPAPPPFDVLYRQARRHLCYHLWKASGEREHLAAILLKKDSARVRRLVEELIDRTWREVAPARGQVGPYFKADPCLTEPHDDHAWVAGKKPETPEEAARFNIFSWLHRSLWSFWENRFEGPRAIVVQVTRHGISIEGILPVDVAQMLYRGETNLPMICQSTETVYDEATRERPALAPEEQGDRPF